jgi:hypothetical protein
MITYSLNNLLLDAPNFDEVYCRDDDLIGPVQRVRWMSNIFRLAVLEEADFVNVANGVYTEHEHETRRLRRASMARGAGRYYPIDGKAAKIFGHLDHQKARKILYRWRARQPIPPSPTTNDLPNVEYLGGNRAHIPIRPDEDANDHAESCQSFPIPVPPNLVPSAPDVSAEPVAPAMPLVPVESSIEPSSREPSTVEWSSAEPNSVARHCHFPIPIHPIIDSANEQPDNRVQNEDDLVQRRKSPSAFRIFIPHQPALTRLWDWGRGSSRPLRSRLVSTLTACALFIAALAIAALWLMWSRTAQPHPIDFTPTTVPKESPNVHGPPHDGGRALPHGQASKFRNTKHETPNTNRKIPSLRGAFPAPNRPPTHDRP